MPKRSKLVRRPKLPPITSASAPETVLTMRGAMEWFMQFGGKIEFAPERIITYANGDQKVVPPRITVRIAGACETIGVDSVWHDPEMVLLLGIQRAFRAAREDKLSNRSTLKGSNNRGMSIAIMSKKKATTPRQ